MNVEHEMIKRKNWNEFRNSGLGLVVNQILHIFGWAIIFEMTGDKVTNIFPARVKFRGFDKESTCEAYVKVTQFLKDNIDDLNEEVKL